MTERLYYTNSYTRQFTARIIEHITVSDRPAVVLDRTYVYPTGGGQPHDTGMLGGSNVVDVFAREGDHAIVHVLDAEIAGETVECEVNWQRRFDLMQHHTGQHILTQAFIMTAEADTVAFHLADTVTIDLDKTLSLEQLAAAEKLANQVVVENRPITASVLSPEAAAHIRMRLTPDYIATDGLRVIDITDFDQTACGGTHVAHTGEVGLIKVTRSQNHKGGTRIEFKCGWRALADYSEKNTLLNDLSNDLTVGYWEVGDAVARLKDELKSTRQQLKTARSSLAVYEVQGLLNASEQRGAVRLIRALFTDRDAGELRSLASQLVEAENVIVLLGLAGEKSQIIAACSRDVETDMRNVLKSALQALGTERGGGRPDFAQGGGIPATPDELELALAAAEALLG